MTEHFVYSELLIFHDCDSVNKHDNIHILWVKSKFKKSFRGGGGVKDGYHSESSRIREDFENNITLKSPYSHAQVFTTEMAHLWCLCN